MLGCPPACSASGRRDASWKRSRVPANDFVNSTGHLPAETRPDEWLAWHVGRGRVDVAELGPPGVLVVHEALAAAAEEAPLVAMTLKARAWKDSGYDPEGLFKASSRVQIGFVHEP